MRSRFWEQILAIKGRLARLEVVEEENTDSGG